MLEKLFYSYFKYILKCTFKKNILNIFRARWEEALPGGRAAGRAHSQLGGERNVSLSVKMNEVSISTLKISERASS